MTQNSAHGEQPHNRHRPPNGHEKPTSVSSGRTEVTRRGYWQQLKQGDAPQPARTLYCRECHRWIARLSDGWELERVRPSAAIRPFLGGWPRLAVS